MRRDAVMSVAATFWWNTAFDAPAKDCYRIVLRARNQRGKVSRRVGGAGRLGTACLLIQAHAA